MSVRRDIPGRMLRLVDSGVGCYTTPFFGTLDPAEAESWLESVERVFTLMQCTPDEKFNYAIFLLQGDAYNWWKTVPSSLAQPPVLNWEDFLREYRNKYRFSVRSWHSSRDTAVAVFRAGCYI